MSGSYIGELSKDDAKWKSGVFILCLLFALIFVAEALTVWVDILSGDPAWVSVPVLVRAAVFAELFLGIWMGWDWLRWLAGAASVGYGLWRIAWSIAVSNAAAAAAGPPVAGAVHQTDWVFVIHMLAGVLYVAFGAFVSLTEGATDFARHRRENGRKGAMFAVFLAGVACVGALFAVRPLNNLWIARLQAQALEFGESSLRDMAAQWDPLVYEAHMTPVYQKQWTANKGRDFFGAMKKFGPLRSVDHPSAPVNASIDGMGHLTIASSYKAHVVLEKLKTKYETQIERGLFMPWMQGMFTLEFDADPAAAPTAPAAAPTPAAGVAPAPALNVISLPTPPGVVPAPGAVPARGIAPATVETTHPPQGTNAVAPGPAPMKATVPTATATPMPTPVPKR